MIRRLLAGVRGAVRPGVLVTGGVAASAVVVVIAATSGGGGGTGCTGAAVTTGTFAARVTASIAGDVLCLNTGSYGQWTGTNKAITVKAGASQTPTMTFDFASGDTGFTLDGMANMGGGIDGATNITIKNSAFTDQIFIDGASTDGIVLDGNTHNWPVTSVDGGINAKIYLANGLTGTLASPSVTVKNSQVWNGDLDGIHMGGGSGYILEDNNLNNICQDGPNHTDNIQVDSSTTTNVRIARNWVHQTVFCGTQGITSYDNGSNGIIIEDNVVALRWGPVMELYGDTNSTVRHNTLIFYAAGATADATHCEFFSQTCGKLIVSRKPANPAGSGTIVRDNIATDVTIGDGSTGTQDHNMCRTTCSGTGSLNMTPVFAGGSDPNTFTSRCDYALALGSPGKGVASDGLDIGIRC